MLRSPSIGLTRGLWRDRQRYLENYWQRIPGVWVQGDLARHDADGLWYMLGRSDDTLKIAGKRTGPAEIESVLLESGLVADAAVVGVPDSISGSALACVCVAAADAAGNNQLGEQISKLVAARFGPPYRPKRVLLVSSLPQTRNQKVMRRLVRAVLADTELMDLSSLANPESLEELRAVANSHRGDRD